MVLPCIVTDINGSREIIVEGENGVIIPPQNEQALYEAMVKMMTDEEGRKRMAGNARRMVAERFEQNYVRQCLFDFYESILGGMKNENENNAVQTEQTEITSAVTFKKVMRGYDPAECRRISRK